MKLRTRLNLVVAGLTAVFVAVLLAEEIQSTRTSVREEIEAANGVASQLLGRLAVIYSRAGGTDVDIDAIRHVQNAGGEEPEEQDHRKRICRRVEFWAIRCAQIRSVYRCGDVSHDCLGGGPIAKESRPV